MKDDIQKVRDYLIAQDQILATVIRRIELETLFHTENYFQKLTESIISQQLSTKAADTITKRFIALFDTKTFPGPEEVLAKDVEILRTAGISYQKISYIKDLSKHVVNKLLNFHLFSTYTDEEIIAHLTQVKGIGRWTAEMFLMFALLRPDIFSYRDLGLRNAIKKLYKLKNHPSEKKAKQISDKWKPYRTIASRYLWKSLELEKV